MQSVPNDPFSFAIPGRFSTTDPLIQFKNQFSPTRILFINMATTILVFSLALLFYEYGIESHLPMLPHYLEVVFMAIVMFVVIPPILYFFSYRPLLTSMSQLQKTEYNLKMLGAALESADDGIVITDTQGEIQWSNPAFTKMTGLPIPEIVGQNIRLFDSAPSTAVDKENRWQTILAGLAWKEELSISHQDGNTTTKEQIITPVRDAGGMISHLIFIEKDITEQRRLEKMAEISATARLALNQSLQVDEVSGVLLDLLVTFVAYDNAAVVLLYHEARWAVRAYRGLEFNEKFKGKDFMTAFQALDGTFVQAMLAKQETVVIPDTAVFFGWQLFVDGDNGRSWLSIPLVIKGQTVGFCILDKSQPYFFTTPRVQVAEALVGQAARAVENARLFEQLEASRERLKLLSHRLVDVQEKERHYIAQELHDEAGQSLASLKIQLLLLARHADQPEIVTAKTADIQQQVDSISENLHRLAAHLRPASLDHLGLVTALSQYVETTCSQFGLSGEFEACGFERRLPPDVETAVYRIVQEALTNVVRHAQATRVDVILKQNKDGFVITVEDNGIGFDLSKTMVGIAAANHLGLIGIRERTEMLGGTLIIDSSTGNGSTLKIEVPYDYSHFIG